MFPPTWFTSAGISLVCQVNLRLMSCSRVKLETFKLITVINWSSLTQYRYSLYPLSEWVVRKVRTQCRCPVRELFFSISEVLLLIKSFCSVGSCIHQPPPLKIKFISKQLNSATMVHSKCWFKHNQSFVNPLLRLLSASRSCICTCYQYSVYICCILRRSPSDISWHSWQVPSVCW